MVIQPFFLSFFFLKDPVDCLVWESSQFPECSCLLTEDPRSEPPSQDQCLCQRACKHLHTVHPTSSAQRGFGNPSNAEEEVYSLKKKKKILFAFICVHFKCTPAPLPLPLPPGTIKSQKTLEKNQVVQLGDLWRIFGKFKLASTKQPAISKHAVSSLSRRASFECASVFMITNCLFFCSFFPVFWLEQIGHLTMTSLCMTMGQRGNVSWQNE